MTHRVPPGLGSFLLSLALAAACVVAPLAGQEEAKCPKKSAAVAVAFDASAGTVSVDKETVEIFRSDRENGASRVCWRVSGLADGQTLHIEGKGGDDSYFPSLERTVTPPRSLARSGAPAKVGTWRYGLRVTDGEGTLLAELDPEVIIRD